MATTKTDARHHICIVDDDEVILKLVATIIAKQMADIQTMSFSESSAAEKWFEVYMPLLLVCDLEMADRNGFHLLKRVKMQSPLTPVIVLTGHGTSNALTSAVQLGADDFFVKPFNPRELLNSIQHFMDRSTRWQRSITHSTTNINLMTV